MFVDREIVQIEVMRIRSIRMYNVCFSNRPRDAHVGGAVGGPNACGRCNKTVYEMERVNGMSDVSYLTVPSNSRTFSLHTTYSVTNMVL